MVKVDIIIILILSVKFEKAFQFYFISTFSKVEQNIIKHKKIR